MMNARWTTTSAPATSASTSSRRVTSPWRYSALRSPNEAGSNGRRAMPITRPTSRARSSARSSGLPMSPVGPVTATVRPDCLGGGTAANVSLDTGSGQDEHAGVVLVVMGGRRRAVQQPLVTRPPAQRAAALELAEGGGDGRAPRADQLG